MRIVMPCIMGLERLVADEIEPLLGPSPTVVLEDAQVSLEAAASRGALSEQIARLNVGLACAERVQLELASARIEDFDRLIEWIESLPWEDWVPEAARIEVDGYSVRSTLFSVTDMQRLIKRGIVERLLRARYGGQRVDVPERSEAGQLLLRFAFRDDVCSLRVDCSGSGLHKRGYRPEANLAPLRETLAAALVRLMRWPRTQRGEAGEDGQLALDEAFYDPFCGSGTLLIEAALHATGQAPGMRRRFAAEDWGWLDVEAFERARREAEARLTATPDIPAIVGSDIDAEALAIAERNIVRAGLSSYIVLERRDALALQRAELEAITGCPRQLIVSNIPYGERLGDAPLAQACAEQLGALALDRTRAEGERVPLAHGLRIGVLALDRDFEQAFGRRADRRRKLYNGNYPCTFYQYFRAWPRSEGPGDRGTGRSPRRRTRR